MKLTPILLIVALSFGLCTSALAADPDEKCAAKKIRAIGKTINTRMACVAIGAVNFEFDPDECIAKAQETLARAFDRAEAAGNGECPTTGDIDFVEDDIEDFIDIVAFDLLP